MAVELEGLARELAGEAPNQRVLECARSAAEAILDVTRIRQTKRSVIERAIRYGDLELTPPEGSIRVENARFDNPSYVTLEIVAYLEPSGRLSRGFMLFGAGGAFEIGRFCSGAD